MKKTLRYTSILTAVFALAMMISAVSLGAAFPVYAEDNKIVTIGEGTTATSDLPYFNSWKNARTQVIYDADDIGTDGSIVSVAYNVASAQTDYKVTNMKIWMGYTDLDYYDYEKTGTVANSEYTLREPDITCVYNGSPQIGTATGWEVIDLDTPFDYDRKLGNLVIVTGVTTSGEGDKNLQYYCTVNSGGDVVRNALTALIRGTDDDPSIADPDAYKGSNYWVIRSVRPNIQLEFDTSGSNADKTYEVTFDADGGEPVPEVQTVSKGGTAAEPEDPVRDGYKFTGWYRGDKLYDFNARVNSDLALKAGWLKLHRIEFVSEDGKTVLQSSEVEDGAMPEYTGETPVKPAEGDTEYEFAGWDPAIREADGPQTYKAVFIDASLKADKTKLEEAIKKAKDARTGVRASDDGLDVGTGFPYVTINEMQAYDDAVAAAQSVFDEPFADQETVDNAVTKLEEAKEVFLAARKDGKKVLPAIEKIVISRESGRQQPAVGGKYEWVVTFSKDADLSKVSDDDFQIQRKPSGADWKNSKCPVAAFAPSENSSETEVTGIVSGLAIPDNVKEGDNTNLWRFAYAGESVDCPVITQEGYRNIDKSALKDAIADAGKAKAGIRVSVNGSDVYPDEQYVTPEEQKALDDAVSAAEEADSNARSTQKQIDTAAENLLTAIDTYNKAKKAGKYSGDTSSGDYRLIYETKKVSLPDIPVREYKTGSGETPDWYTGEPVRFELFDSTTQESGGIYTTKSGTYTDGKGEKHEAQLLSGASLIRGHKYIISVFEKDYMISNEYTVNIDDDGSGGTDTYKSNMANYYITLSEDGKLPTDIKKGGTLKSIDIIKRSSSAYDETDARRVTCKMPVYYTEDGTFDTVKTAVRGAVIRFVSPQETLLATSDDYGNITVDLIEDINYMVQLVDDSGALALSSFPLTVKDHAENGWPKSIYNHFGCTSVQGLFLVDKRNEHDADTTMVSLSGKTTVTGMNFRNGVPTDTEHYFINDRQLNKSSVKDISGKDAEVFIIEAINMYRTELSRLAGGSFKVTRKVPSGKQVDKVYYVNKYGKLKSLSFKESGGKVAFTMSTLSMYPNVIVYKPSEGKNTGASGDFAEKEKKITAVGVKNDKDPAGSVFSKLRLLSSKQTKNSVTVKWAKVKGAKKYVLYGSLSGKGKAVKKIVSTSKRSYKVTKAAGKKLKKGKYYKFIVAAVDADGNVISMSKVIHVATKGGKAGNYKKVTTKAKNSKVKIKRKKSFKLRGKQVRASKKLKVKKYAKLRYESSNKKIATVSSKGVIKGKKKGTCYVYAYTQSGTYAKVKVTVR